MKDHRSIARSDTAFQAFSSHAELYAMGKRLREKCPLKSHAIWKRARNRPDPLHLLEESNKGRIPALIPIRYGRMLQSPFTFYRGTALNMAADLATTPVSGLRVQACGDCHLCNFGGFATPERRVIVDINDLDETLPAPWEWDVKRLAASFVLASRNNGHSEDDARDAALACVRSYRKRMADFSQMRVLDIWYSSIDLDQLVASFPDKATRKRGQIRLEKARQRCVVEHDFPSLVCTAGGGPTIKENPPLIYHPRARGREEFHESIQRAFAAYRESLPEHRRLLLDRYKFRDLAVKVVGVGSVGTACGVMLTMASENDPLFLQVKEARASVLEAYAGKSAYANHGQRVVMGHKLVQSASDLFLGWTKAHSRPALLRPPAQGHEDQAARRVVCATGHASICPSVWLDPGPVPRPLRRAGHDQRLHGQERQVRPGHRRLLNRLCGSKRTRPRNPHESRACGKLEAFIEDV